MKDFLIKHKWGMMVAFLVGLICILPQIIFIVSLGDDYRGIHMFATPNEDAYMGIMREILDGHTKVSSMPFFEYKDVGVPLLPTTLFFIYTLPVQIFNISLVNVVIISKFILPFILFFFIYLFVYDLLGWGVEEKNKNNWRIFFAITAGIMIVFGFDLVGYNSWLSYLKGTSVPQGFLVWTRPVNPISGAILLFFFLYSLNKLNLQRKDKWIFWCGLSLAGMMGSYVFSWTLAVVILGLFGLLALYKKNWMDFINYLIVLFLGILFSISYWLNNYKASKMEWYSEASARIGMFFTHTPHFNKFVLASIFLFLVASVYAYYKKILKRPLPYWWSFSAILLSSSFIVYNQQLITGVEIWYYHYVFYTIPIGYIVFIIILYYLGCNISRRIVLFVICALFIISTFFGLYQQVGGYKNNFIKYTYIQRYQDIFDFFNTQADKDCVVLVKEENIGEWSNFITTFTHCNTYYSGENQSVLANPDDFYHRYLSLLRLRGVSGEEIEKYILDNKSEVEHALQYQLQRTLGFPDLRLEKRLSSMPEDYRKFVANDFYTELSKFKIDYILSEGELSEEIKKEFNNLKKVYSKNNIFIYQF